MISFSSSSMSFSSFTTGVQPSGMKSVMHHARAVLLSSGSRARTRLGGIVTVTKCGVTAALIYGAAKFRPAKFRFTATPVFDQSSRSFVVDFLHKDLEKLRVTSLLSLYVTF